MKIVHVTTINTITLPERGTQEYDSLYARWFEEVGEYYDEGDPLPQGDAVYEYLAQYVSEEFAVGNYLELLSGQDININVEKG